MGAAKISDAHAAAIERAFALIEASQGELDPARTEKAARELEREGWPDVQVLAHFSRSLAAREAGIDDSAHVQNMLDAAISLDEPALVALALATSALRRTDPARAAGSDGPLTPFARAVGLLDRSGGPMVYRVAAQIEIGQVAHLLGYWEIALERYDLAEDAMAANDDPRWDAYVRRCQVVNVINRVDLVLDWCSAQAMIGEWAGAAMLAGTALPGDENLTDWPSSWAFIYQGYLHLLASMAGHDSIGGGSESVERLGHSIVAARRGDVAEAARLAQGLADTIGSDVPRNGKLLAMSLAAHGDGTPEAALRYGDELARLRWSDRLDRMSNVRGALAVERRRLEHEQLRRDILTDELTGLANRRGFHAYLTGTMETQEVGDGDDGYAVMMIDVDRFKTVNDRFGHDVGDLVLAEIGRILATHVRPFDLAARLGGDEFLIILARVRPDVLQVRAQAILDAVRHHPWAEIASGLAVSVSVGVHHGAPHELSGLLSGADRHLYQAKSEGRGRISASTG